MDVYAVHEMACVEICIVDVGGFLAFFEPRGYLPQYHDDHLCNIIRFQQYLRIFSDVSSRAAVRADADSYAKSSTSI